MSVPMTSLSSLPQHVSISTINSQNVPTLSFTLPQVSISHGHIPIHTITNDGAEYLTVDHNTTRAIEKAENTLIVMLVRFARQNPGPHTLDQLVAAVQHYIPNLRKPDGTRFHSPLSIEQEAFSLFYYYSSTLHQNGSHFFFLLSLLRSKEIPIKEMNKECQHFLFDNFNIDIFFLSHSFYVDSDMKGVLRKLFVEPSFQPACFTRTKMDFGMYENQMQSITFKQLSNALSKRTLQRRENI